MRIRSLRPAFTLIELLVVVAIIALLISILLPSLAGARAAAKKTKCGAQLHAIGTGGAIYLNENSDILPAGRLPKVDTCNWTVHINGGLKFRPTFLALMSTSVTMPCFLDPQGCEDATDSSGAPGDQQEFSSPLYVCPLVAKWTNERNACYGYNYQFLGNANLAAKTDPYSFKRWPVPISRIHDPARTVSIGESMGTAATYPAQQRMEYGNTTRDTARMGNNGYFLDPPRVAAEMVNNPNYRSAVDARHGKRANILWVDEHVDAQTTAQLGYVTNSDGKFPNDDPNASNAVWTGNGSDVAWTPAFHT